MNLVVNDKGFSCINNTFQCYNENEDQETYKNDKTERARVTHRDDRECIAGFHAGRH